MCETQLVDAVHSGSDREKTGVSSPANRLGCARACASALRYIGQITVLFDPVFHDLIEEDSTLKSPFINNLGH